MLKNRKIKLYEALRGVGFSPRSAMVISQFCGLAPDPLRSALVLLRTRDRWYYAGK